ncbi:dihydrolipoamide acetyltransferase family protein [Ilyobacter polytropus]|uniref:Dihydrolipoamide acetyltransferase component of pyruvate dehydrogenase complex n=1 Tax=Ilyobacter polytropus (strain ATCC 51220 / DSM 2926 / LMG 16218 / CuHBu1) TaxID=572544 RepID=E3HAD0_ILYPC|nr:dihydrolipoamide acetyltransferase family protein [Ilyobacter polytropus]ADO83660.1 catalytic domain of components of various dehydrogenase complexes [Ilyobacter polytropus DSM 2926]
MYHFKFADIGEGIHEGKLLEWMVSEGDSIKSGDSLFLVETDKVNAEIPSPVKGVVAKLMAQVGDVIKVGDIIVDIEEEGSLQDTKPQKKELVQESDKPQEEVVKKEKTEEKGAGVVGEITVSNDLIPSFSQEKSEKPSLRKKVLATPVARKMAKDLGVDITLVKGSGTMGRVMKEDIKNFHSSDNKKKETNQNISALTSSQSGSIEEVELSGIRKTISKSMTLSKQIIPHTVLMDEFDVTSLVEFRKEAKQEALLQGVKLTYMPFIIKAVTIALKEFPLFNCVYDHENEKLLFKKFYNIGVATDTPEGLMVPVIKNTDHMGLLETAKEMNRLVEASKNKKLTLDDIKDGTFSITNYGAIGSLFGTPIIKHPQVAILGIGRVNKKPVVSEEGNVEVRDIMPISMAVDHRIIDGADAGRFAERLKQLLSNPKLLLMS